MLLVLVGKSASGKDTIKKEVIKYGIRPVTTYTTRPKRPGEIDGQAYHFISDSEFERKNKKGEFVESTSYQIATGEIWHYATPKSELFGNKILILNPDGLKALRDKNIACIAFYIDVSSGTLKNRLRLRGDNPEEAKRRMLADEKDFKDIDKYIDFSIHNENDMTPELAAQIIFDIYKIYKERGRE